MTPRRAIAVTLVAVLVALPAIGAAVLVRMLPPAAVTQRLIAELRRATGREVSARRLTVRLLPDLTIDADDIALANPAGFSRSAMLTARHARIRVALLPLLSHQVIVREVALTGVDLKLERPAGAAANWRFAPGRRSAKLADRRVAAAAPLPPLLGLRILGVKADGVVSWQTPGGAGSIVARSLRMIEVNASSSINLSLLADVAGEAVTLTGRFGGQNHLWDAADSSDWPVELRSSAADGVIAVTGSIARPREFARYDFGVVAHGADLGRLFTPWPGLGVPRLRDATLDTWVIDRIDGVDVPRLALIAGPSDVSASVAGLQLERLAIAAPNIGGASGNQLNRIDADGQYAGQALVLRAMLGPVGRLVGAGGVERTPIALDATVQVAGATLRAAGRVQPSGDWSGTDATLHAGIPDLAALSGLAGRALPHLADLYLDGTIRGARGVLSMPSMHLSSPLAEIQGLGSARLGGRPRYDVTLQVARIDLDGLLQAIAPVPGRAQGRAGPVPAGLIIPDRALALGGLGAIDGSLAMDVTALRFRGIDIAGLSGIARLQSGLLVVGPTTAGIGSGRLSATVSADSAAVPPAFAVTLAGDGLDMASLAALLGAPQGASGRVDLAVRLTGSGTTLHAIAGSLTGTAGLALTDGALGNRLLLTALAALMPAGQLSLKLPAAGMSTVTCLATRLELRDGIATPLVFLLDMNRLRVALAGSVDLGSETLALRLRPYLQIGATGLVLPSTAAGPWRTPRLALEPPGSLAVTPALALADSGECADALAAARGTAVTFAAPAFVPRRVGPARLLRRLLGGRRSP